jgi:glycosyltransferase involved in cell wall biosynthesis
LQEAPKGAWEVLVVDNNSTDGSEAEAALFKRAGLPLRHVREPRQGLAHARNRGLAESRGRYLLYLDDDVLPPRGFLAAVLAVIERERPDIAGGPVYPYYTSPRPGWFRDSYEARRHAERSGFSRQCRVSGGNFLIRRPVLEAWGPFDPNLGMRGARLGLGEEAKVLDCYRLGVPLARQRVYYSRECWVYHHTPPRKMRLGYMLRRAFLGGELAAELTALKFPIRPWHAARAIRYTVIGLGGEFIRDCRSGGPLAWDFPGLLLRAVTQAGRVWGLAVRCGGARRGRSPQPAEPGLQTNAG